MSPSAGEIVRAIEIRLPQAQLPRPSVSGQERVSRPGGPESTEQGKEAPASQPLACADMLSLHFQTPGIFWLQVGQRPSAVSLFSTTMNPTRRISRVPSLGQ